MVPMVRNHPWRTLKMVGEEDTQWTGETGEIGHIRPVGGKGGGTGTETKVGYSHLWFARVNKFESNVCFRVDKTVGAFG